MNYAKLVPTLFAFFCINYNSLCFHKTHLCLHCYIFFFKVLLVKRKLYTSILQVVLILQFMVQSTCDLGTDKGLIALDFSQRDAQGPAVSWNLHTCRCSETSTLNSQVTGTEHEVPRRGYDKCDNISGHFYIKDLYVINLFLYIGIIL